MAHFQIGNRYSGKILGIYEAETAADALDVMARDAGYASYAAACEVTQSGDDELVVTEVPRIITCHGDICDFDAVVNLMDDEIREAIHTRMAGDCTEQQFFDAYCAAHAEEFGKEFVVN
jgi:RecB family endonuclease NucS